MGEPSVQNSFFFTLLTHTHVLELGGTYGQNVFMKSALDDLQSVAAAAPSAGSDDVVILVEATHVSLQDAIAVQAKTLDGVGTQIAGTVWRVGAGVTRLKVGDKVVGKCACGFGTYGVAPQSGVALMPPSTSPAMAVVAMSGSMVAPAIHWAPGATPMESPGAPPTMEPRQCEPW